MRVCIVYDCLFPWTVGGGERWYRNLATALVDAGHDVTYLTRRQWPAGEEPHIPGVTVVAVSADDGLYDDQGRRRIGPPLRFGWGVLRHLLRNRHRYDAVHTCAFPYFALPAIRLALLGTRVRLAVDWFEVWSRQYWREYLGPLKGGAAELVQRLCIRLTPDAFVLSRLYAGRLRENGLRSEPTVLDGLYAGPLDVDPDAEAPRTPLVVFAGRHIPEKRVTLVPAVVAAVRRQVPEVRGLILGDGPERDAVLQAIQRHGVADVVEAPGFVEPDAVADALARASCLLLPSSREGYGLVVIEAAAAATPSVVVAGPDNAATELIAENENGHVAPADDAETIADTVVRAIMEGPALRARTAAWFSREAPRLRVDGSLGRVLERYGA